MGYRPTIYVRKDVIGDLLCGVMFSIFLSQSFLWMRRGSGGGSLIGGSNGGGVQFLVRGILVYYFKYCVVTFCIKFIQL
jgi:hypothetical protein